MMKLDLSTFVYLALATVAAVLGSPVQQALALVVVVFVAIRGLARGHAATHPAIRPPARRVSGLPRLP